MTGSKSKLSKFKEQNQTIELSHSHHMSELKAEQFAFRLYKEELAMINELYNKMQEHFPSRVTKGEIVRSLIVDAFNKDSIDTAEKIQQLHNIRRVITKNKN